MNDQTHILGQGIQTVGQFRQRTAQLGNIHQHNHGEDVVLKDRLGYIQDIGIGGSTFCGNSGDNAHHVLAYNGNYSTHK